jgi:hypothetical protein
MIFLSRNNTNSILNTEVWGDLVMHKNGIKITVPRSTIGYNGHLPSAVRDKLKKLTPQNATVLYVQYGITCECEGSQFGSVLTTKTK